MELENQPLESGSTLNFREVRVFFCFAVVKVVMHSSTQSFYLVEGLSLLLGSSRTVINTCVNIHKWPLQGFFGHHLHDCVMKRSVETTKNMQ